MKKQTNRRMVAHNKHKESYVYIFGNVIRGYAYFQEKEIINNIPKID